MPSTDLTVAEPRQAAPEHYQHTPAHRDSKPLRITRKVKAAIDAMVWDGLTRKQAAQTADLKDNSLYIALNKPDVRRYYLAQLDVLRTSERSRNIHTLAEVRDQTSNQMARVAAAKALEQIDDAPAQRAGNAAFPGITVIINTASVDTPHMHTIDAKPLSGNDGG